MKRQMSNRKYILAWIVIYFLISCAVFTGAAVAQDAPIETPTAEVTVAPTPEPVVTPVPDPTPAPVVPPVFQAPDTDAVINAAFLALLAAFSTGILSPLTSTLVSLVKRIPLGIVQGASGEQINLAVAVLLSVGMWAGSHFGFGQQVATGYQLLYAVLPILAGAGANFLSNQKVYEALKGNMPVIGYSRSA